MQLIEQTNGISTVQPRRESTHRLRLGGRNGTQEYLERGCGKSQNTDFEPLHYQDT